MGHLYDAIVESKRIDEQESKPARYSDGKDGTWWYFTTHGVQPGSVPKDLHVVDTIETSNGTYVGLDGILNTSELKKYDMKEKTPPKETQKETVDESVLNESEYVDIEQYLKPENYIKSFPIKESAEPTKTLSESDMEILSKHFE